MFFSILIPDLRVVAHSQWSGHGRNTECKLRILTTQEAARNLIDQFPKEESTELAKHLPYLRETGPDLSVEVEGDAASSLSNLVATYFNSVSWCQHLPMKQELLGFWEPPETGAPGEGIIMWSDMDVNYHVAIVYSKEQAERLICGFNWLHPERRNRLLGRIKKWNTQQSPLKNEQRIAGVPAKLLCRVSIAAKVIKTMK